MVANDSAVVIRHIPLSKLRHACKAQLDIVKREWPDGVPLTKEAMNRCLSLGLDLVWAAEELLDSPARADYERVAAPARGDYERVTATAWAEYQRVTATAWAEYDRVRATALLELLIRQYRKAVAS